ncbi:hypothetical protein OQA88_2654 [Cercophora sp. LCS_1]
MADEPTVDVVVVGAGLSGLRAAVDLHQSGLSVAVLESNATVGGKVLSSPVLGKEQVTVDLGASWINDTTQTEMYSLVERFGLDTIKQHVAGKYLFQNETGTVVPFELGSGFTTQHPDTMRVYELLGGVAITFNDAEDRTLDLVSLRAFAEANTENSLVGGKAANDLSLNILGANASDVSALFMVDLIRGATGLENMLSTGHDGAMYLRIRQGQSISPMEDANLKALDDIDMCLPGASAIALGLASLLPRKSIYLSTKASSITQTPEGCLTKSANGLLFRSKKVIVSIPTTWYPFVSFDPPLPVSKQTVTDSVIGFHGRVVLTYSGPWWREAGLSGVMESTKMGGPIAVTSDTSSDQDAHYSLTCLLVGSVGRWCSKQLSNGPVGKDIILKHLEEVFGPRVPGGVLPAPLAMVYCDWNGGTTSVMRPGTAYESRSIGDRFGHVHFVGTETSKEWRGYMEGAVRSGIRGANEVIDEWKDGHIVGGKSPKSML